MPSDVHKEVSMMQSEGCDDDAYSNQVGQSLVWLKANAQGMVRQDRHVFCDYWFQISNAKFSLYVKKIEIGIVMVVIYVDDLIITSDNHVDIGEVKLLLKQKFEMQDLGYLHYFLGIEIIRSP